MPKLKKPTTTILSSLVNPSTFGQPATFTATTVAGNGSSVSGTVTFRDGTTVLGTVSTSGTVSFATSSLSVGTHSITATYNGQGPFGSSTSLPVGQTVNPVVLPPPPPSPSPDGTRVPPATQIVDNSLNVWTIRSSDRAILENGQQIA